MIHYHNKDIAHRYLLRRVSQLSIYQLITPPPRKLLVFLLFGVFTLSLCACTQKIEPKEILSEAPISFNAPILSHRSTKSRDEFALIVDFFVVAQYYSTDFTFWTEGTPFFDNGSLASHISNVLNEGIKTWDGWKTTPKTYYWPKKGSLSFQAYAPASSEDGSYSDAYGNSITSIIANDTTPSLRGSVTTEVIPLNTGLPRPEGLAMTAETVLAVTPIIDETGINATVSLSTTPGNQIDFLYSERVINKRGNQKWESNIDTYPNLYGVQIPFHHALCKITFQSLLRSSLSSGECYKITGIEINKIKTTGDFNQGLNNNTIDGKKTDFTPIENWTPWIASGDLNDYSNAVEGEGREIISVNPDSTGYKEVYLIPQAIDDSFELLITYKETTATTPETTKTKTINKTDLQDAGINEFVIGKNYVFNFLLGKDRRIYFEPFTKDWIDKDLSGDIHYEL